MNDQLNLKKLSEVPLVELDIDSNDIWIEDKKVFDGKRNVIIK